MGATTATDSGDGGDGGHRREEHVFPRHAASLTALSWAGMATARSPGTGRVAPEEGAFSKAAV